MSTKHILGQQVKFNYTFQSWIVKVAPILARDLKKVALNFVYNGFNNNCHDKSNIIFYLFPSCAVNNLFPMAKGRIPATNNINIYI